ncbi:hypothetical protein PR202_ga23511 [Eleusine coracana subsp. coracana]|uniref:RNase H type-1 domain-containing protein n=1 Tax=Eleusine coracana subsp. coracana TaxID=191504 RepID=A0AAV5D6P4_ELECO|nr:hypothetical protein PR202_ga23511 [Eleusine coracana subsp. coracana]
MEQWEPLPQNWIKININGAFDQTRRVGLGVVIQDCQGKVLLTFWRVLFDSTSAEEVDARACRKGLDLAVEWVKKKGIIESDCLSIITMVNSNEKSRSML